MSPLPTHLLPPTRRLASCLAMLFSVIHTRSCQGNRPINNLTTIVPFLPHLFFCLSSSSPFSCLPKRRPPNTPITSQQNYYNGVDVKLILIHSTKPLKLLKHITVHNIVYYVNDWLCVDALLKTGRPGLLLNIIYCLNVQILL